MLSNTELTTRLIKAYRKPDRGRIIRRLRHRHATLDDLSNDLMINKANLSQHLAALRVCGLVVSERQGRCLRYALPIGPLRAIIDDLSSGEQGGGARI